MWGGFPLIREHLGTRDFSRTCRQTRYPDPKLSPLHETGASPGHPPSAGLALWAAEPDFRDRHARDWPTRVRLRPAVNGVLGTSAHVAPFTRRNDKCRENQAR